MKVFINIIFIFIFAGCGATQKTLSSDSLYLEPHVLSNSNSAPGWLAYGMALAAWEKEYLPDGSPDMFKREIYARETAAQMWKELKQNGESKSDPDLDILEAISDAGFMEEYLWIHFKQENWSNPGTLELDKFKKWSVANLVDHVPVSNTGVSVEQS